MPEEKITFRVGEEVYDIPPDKRDAFKSKYPDAIELKSFVVGRDTFDIPQEKVQKFLEKYPDAKPTFGLGKPSAAPQPGGGGGSPLNVTPGTPSGQSPFGMGSIAEKIGQPQPIQATTPQSNVEPQQVATPQITFPEQPDFTMGGIAQNIAGEQQAVPEGELRMPTEQEAAAIEQPYQTPEEGFEQAYVGDASDVFQQYTQKKAEVDKMPAGREKDFQKTLLYEGLAQFKQRENVGLEESLTERRSMLEGIDQSLKSLRADIDNPEIQPEMKEQLMRDYDDLLLQGREIEDQYNTDYQKYLENSKFAATMLRGAKESGGSVLNPLQSLGLGAYGGVVPGILRSVGYGIKGLSKLTSALPKTKEMIDVENSLANAFNQWADNEQKDVEAFQNKYSREIQKNPFDELTLDNGFYTAGQLISSIVTTVAGGAGAGVAGARAVAAAQVYGDMVKAGEEAGLSESEALAFALPLAATAAYFSDKGVEAMAGVMKGITKQGLKSAVQELGTKPTFKALMDAGSKFVKNSVEGGIKEGLQEGVEFSVEFGSKLLGEQIEGVDFKDDLSAQAFLEGFGQNAALGGIAGTAFGGIFGANPANGITTLAMEATQSPEKAQKFFDDLKTYEAAGQITPEQKAEAEQIFQKAIETSAQVPPTVKDIAAKARAVELIQEQQDLTAQIEQTNPAMVAPLEARLNEVNSELGAIAEGEPDVAQPETPVSETPVSETPAKAEEAEAVTPTAQDFSAFEAKGKEGRKARAELRERIGKEAYAKMEQFNKDFEKTVDSLESEGKIKQRCK